MAFGCQPGKFEPQAHPADSASPCRPCLWRLVSDQSRLPGGKGNCEEQKRHVEE